MGLLYRVMLVPGRNGFALCLWGWQNLKHLYFSPPPSRHPPFGAAQSGARASERLFRPSQSHVGMSQARGPLI